jgi:hypothetical protein
VRTNMKQLRAQLCTLTQHAVHVDWTCTWQPSGELLMVDSTGKASPLQTFLPPLHILILQNLLLQHRCHMRHTDSLTGTVHGL